MCATLKTLKTKPRLFFASIAVFTLILLFTLYKSEFIFVKECNAPLPCYCSRTGDALQSAEDPSFAPKGKSIFFLETSCRGSLTFRQACSVEAAARAHPNREVFVLFSAPVTDYDLKTGSLAVLLNIHNVKFLRVHLAEYAKETIVQSILQNDVKEGKHQVEHTADILRILTLIKWGGIYLDTDMIVTRSLDHLPSNFIVKEYLNELATAIMSFAKDKTGTYVLNEIIKDIREEYDPTLWTYTGPESFDRVLERLCPKVILSPVYRTSVISNCQGVIIFHPELFYPHHYTQYLDIFDKPKKMFDLYRPYTYHMYSMLSSDLTINRGSVYDLVAQAFCPTIHTEYYYEFSTPSL